MLPLKGHVLIRDRWTVSLNCVSQLYGTALRLRNHAHDSYLADAITGSHRNLSIHDDPFT